VEAGTAGLRDYATSGAGLGRREECGARAIRLLAAASVSEAAAVVAIDGAGRLECGGNER